MVAQASNAWWVFVLLGLFAGVISGGLGLGAGTVIVPALVLLCGFAQKSAQGTALAAMVPMALVGALRYYKIAGVEMEPPVIILIACGALVGTLFGTELAGRLPGDVLRRIFAVFLVLVGARMFVRSTRPTTPTGQMGVSSPVQTDLIEDGDIKKQ